MDTCPNLIFKYKKNIANDFIAEAGSMDRKSRPKKKNVESNIILFGFGFQVHNHSYPCVNTHVDLQIIRLSEDGTTALAPDAGQPATGHPLGAFFAAVKIGVGNRRLIRRLGGSGGTGVNAALVSLQLADTLEALAADGAGVDDAWGVSLYRLSIFPFLHLSCRSSYILIIYIYFQALQGRLESPLCIDIAKPYRNVKTHLFQNGRLLLTCMNIYYLPP